jgi:hypothetical protein
MIIFEGPDNTGKSTAVKQVLHRIPSLVFGGHSGGPPKSCEEWEGRMNTILIKPTSETIPLVLDRFFFSEKVYGKILRPDSNIIPRRLMNTLEQRLLEHDPLIIYCRRPYHRILHGFDDRSQLTGVKENLITICREYDILFSQGWSLGNRLYVYNFEEPLALSYLCQAIEEYLFERGLKCTL